MKNPQSLFFFSQSGCLLPILIVLNLLFGWMFFRPLVWLLIEAALILIFLLNSFAAAKKIISGPPLKRRSAIDVEAEVVDEDKSGKKNKKS